MIRKAMFCGVGGQGILMMGHTLSRAAMKEGKQLAYLPSYGAEVRGGTAHCTVSIGDEEIASPIASTPDYLVVMNAPSLKRFQSVLRKGGHLLINTSLVHEASTRRDVRIHEIPVSELAESLGDLRCANMLMLGAFLKVSRLVKPETMIEVIVETFRAKGGRAVERNREAFWTGHRYFDQGGGSCRSNRSRSR